MVAVPAIFSVFTVFPSALERTVSSNVIRLLPLSADANIFFHPEQKNYNRGDRAFHNAR